MQRRALGVTIGAQLGRRFLEAVAVTLGARDLADVLLVSDRGSHVAPGSGNVLRCMRPIHDTARNEHGTAHEHRKRDDRDRDASGHRAPSG